RPSLLAGRHVARPAPAARRLGDVREHAGAGVAAAVRRVLLAQPYGRLRPAGGRLLRARGRGPDHARRTVSSARRRSSRPLDRLASGDARAEQGPRAFDRGDPLRTTSRPAGERITTIYQAA